LAGLVAFADDDRVCFHHFTLLMTRFGELRLKMKNFSEISALSPEE